MEDIEEIIKLHRYIYFFFYIFSQTERLVPFTSAAQEGTNVSKGKSLFKVVCKLKHAEKTALKRLESQQHYLQVLQSPTTCTLTKMLQGDYWDGLSEQLLFRTWSR